MLQMMSNMPQLILNFGNETLQSSEVVDHFKCPAIVFSHGGGSFWTLNQMIGNPTAVSAVPSLFVGKLC